MALTALFLLLFLVLTHFFWPEGWSLLQEVIVPGDNAVAVAALDDLTAELKSGVELFPALLDFANRILEGIHLGFR